MNDTASKANSPKQLKRELGFLGTIIMGLSSMIGTGVFVSIGIAAGISNSGVIIAVILAGLLAICNSLNMAQLAANHSVSGGVYEYGYKYLTPWLGFTGGWMYLLAKIASSATAALGFSGYLLKVIGVNKQDFLVPIALTILLIITLIVISGMRRSKVTTLVMVSVTLGSLLFLIITGFIMWPDNGWENLTISKNISPESMGNILEATALMFVAYTGYGRIATMSEEVLEPRKNIPKAMTIATFSVMLLYIAVAIVSIGSIGAEAFSNAAMTEAAPLEAVAKSFGIPGTSQILAVGALTAMLGVLLSAILGLSRMLLAMARRGDMPTFIAKLNSSATTPYWAVIMVSGAIALLILIGDVKVTWSFSAFASLIRSVITNLSALKMSAEERFYPQWLAWLGLLPCLFLAFCIEPKIWLIGLLFVVAGIIWHFAAHLIPTKNQVESNKV